MAEPAPAPTASGKTASSENFPVGSFLIAKPLRPHVAAYYRFARTADDISDHPGLPSSEKVAGLRAMGRALISGKAETPEAEAALPLKRSLEETGVDPRHALDLLIAFERDSLRDRTHCWDDLIDYCRNSAMPVGRFLLELHAEKNPDAWLGSDALCSALQILNHLQDMKPDYLELGRSYCPEDWMAEAGANFEDLEGTALTPGLEAVMGRMLDATKPLIDTAALLPPAVTSRGLRMESAVIVRLAQRLYERLRRGDPLAARVKLTPWDFLAATVSGAVSGYFPP
ncbi:MAG: squalene synthase HpnC [Alphaproteobacteria bacterium]|nr:squalene synthase HpnC [Alphaproteobacteria bacterium]